MAAGMTTGRATMTMATVGTNSSAGTATTTTMTIASVTRTARTSNRITGGMFAAGSSGPKAVLNFRVDSVYPITINSRQCLRRTTATFRLRRRATGMDIAMDMS